MLYHIREGSYGQDISLNGLDAIYAASWSKAIHEGNGTMQLYITRKADDQQRQVLVNIMSGQAKGDGPFALFATMMKFILDPQFVDIVAIYTVIGIAATIALAGFIISGKALS